MRHPSAAALYGRRGLKRQPDTGTDFSRLSLLAPWPRWPRPIWWLSALAILGLAILGTGSTWAYNRAQFNSVAVVTIGNVMETLYEHNPGSGPIQITTDHCYAEVSFDSLDGETITFEHDFDRDFGGCLSLDGQTVSVAYDPGNPTDVSVGSKKSLGGPVRLVALGVGIVVAVLVGFVVGAVHRRLKGAEARREHPSHETAGPSSQPSKGDQLHP